MQRRPLERCGLEAGVAGLGCEGLPGRPEEHCNQDLDMKEAAGANAIGPYSPDPEMRVFPGRALTDRHRHSPACQAAQPGPLRQNI